MAAPPSAATPELVRQAPHTIGQFLNTIGRTVESVWAEFVMQLPFIGIAVLILVLTWLGAMFARKLGRRVAGERARPSLLHLVQRLLTIAIWAAGLMLAAIVVFPGLSPAKALGGLGLLSVAVGFAFRDTFENFFAGMLMLWKYPFEDGDFIQSGEIIGRVEHIHVRMTTIRKTTGELLLVPNSTLFSNPVEVLTNQPERRVSVMTGVAYSVDLAAAIEVIWHAVTNCGAIMGERPVQVFAHGFGDSGMDIEIAWWCGATPLAERQSRNAVVVAVKQALDAAGMEIPFPYRTLTFKEPLSIRPDDRRG